MHDHLNIGAAAAVSTTAPADRDEEARVHQGHERELKSAVHDSFENGASSRGVPRVVSSFRARFRLFMRGFRLATRVRQRTSRASERWDRRALKRFHPRV